MINDDQELLDNQLHNLKLKQLLRETLDKLRKSSFSINEALEKGSNSDDFIFITSKSKEIVFIEIYFFSCLLFKETSQSIEQNNQTCNEHAKAFSESTLEALTASFERILPNKNKSDESVSLFGLEEALKHVNFNFLIVFQ